MKQARVPTLTTLVQEALARADDFMTAAQLAEITKHTPNQVSTALWALSNYKVVESVESQGRLWWFLTTTDTRTRIFEERTPETKPRRTRRATKKVP